MAAHLSRPTLSLRLTNLRLITLEELLEVQNVPAREVRTKREQRVERKAPKGYEIVGSRMGSGGFELLSLQISNQDPQSVSHSSRCARSGCRYRRTHPSYVCGQRFPRSELVDVIATNAPRILWFLKHVRYPECPPDRISTVVRNQQTAVAGINLGVKVKSITHHVQQFTRQQSTDPAMRFGVEWSLLLAGDYPNEHLSIRSLKISGLASTIVLTPRD
ncbi:hypothetical protein C8F04DRAFT_1232008 [Mycena alexandri]|uniref:Uncharacterized protein n=1 Tax=Mycena alexandri TaxID=1745969 RepID=A0AAD6T323_9AGAR|nr:hypothetical protein C8F04DRAFT_1232008 [Mycena alexandri]